ncbi:glycosyltransferase family A protein [Oscillospiraceae bacterium 38-13]
MEHGNGVVSVVTPVYNGEACLPAMLDSLLAQSYPLLELILVDDGSADGTLRTAESYREAFAARGYGFRVVPGPHENASAAVSRGLPYVTGEFLIWPDSDDILEPDSVRRRVDFLRAHPEYQCVRSLSYYFDWESGRKLDRRDEQTGDLTREDLFWDVLEGRTFVCCGCYMLRTKPFFAIYPERRIPVYPVGQNFQMLLPFLYRHKCPTLPEELYGVAVRPGSHSRTPLTQAQEETKYAGYERLADEIAAICGMEDQASLDRVACWKLRRRFQLAVKYGQTGTAFQALLQLRRHKGLRLREVWRQAILLCLSGTRPGRWLYGLYRKIKRA